MSALRVAITARSVFPLHGLGGLERSVYDLARHLVREGVSVDLITRPPSGSADIAGIAPSVRPHYVPYRTFPLAGRRGTTVLDRSTAYPLFGLRAGAVAARLVEDGSVDIVHGFGASVLGYARRHPPLRAPLVLNPQGLEEFGASDPSRARLKRLAYFPLQRAVRACARRADAVIATDVALEPVVRMHLPGTSDRMVTIPNALDLDEIDALAGPEDGERVRGAAGIARDEVVLLSVGRIEQNKGFHLLAAALAALREHSGRLAQGQWRWVIVGKGPFEAALRRQLADARLSGQVVFAGRATDRDLHGWYEAADLFVHPSLYEGSSLVTLEAMAHRRACVVSDAGGLADKVRSGVNGWIVPAGDPSALAAAVSGALEDRGRRERFGRTGRAVVEQTFSWRAAARRTIDLYEHLMGKRGKIPLSTLKVWGSLG